MARFAPRRNLFIPDPEAIDSEADAGDDYQGLPAPLVVKLKAIRQAGIREAREVLTHLPEPGESLHAICTARMDLTDVINALIDRLGTVERLSMATLGFNQRNLNTIERWFDSGRVKAMTLLSSIFLRAHKGALWEEALSSFRDRGQRAACCHSHCKVVTMAFVSGQKMTIEGSANLCGNGSGREQFAMIRDDALHDWHAAWIDTLVSKHGETKESETGEEEGDRQPGPGARG